MGLVGTIKRADGQPLGAVAVVQQELAAAFLGITFGRQPSGPETIRAAKARGVEFPDVIRQHFESMPAKYGGDYEGPGFSAQFTLGSSDIVQAVDVVLYGNTSASELMFALLVEQTGWFATFP